MPRVVVLNRPVGVKTIVSCCPFWLSLSPTNSHSLPHSLTRTPTFSGEMSAPPFPFPFRNLPQLSLTHSLSVIVLFLFFFPSVFRSSTPPFCCFGLLLQRSLATLHLDSVFISFVPRVASCCEGGEHRQEAGLQREFSLPTRDENQLLK